MIDEANPGALWAAVALGVCVGFLPHNLHPARVFMGDGGALLLGALMAAATISVGGRSTVEFSGQAFFFYAPLLIPLVILGRARGRHGLRHRAPHGGAPRVLGGRPRPPSPPPHAPRPTGTAEP